MTLNMLFDQFILDKKYITGLSANTIINYKKSFIAFCKHTVGMKCSKTGAGSNPFPPLSHLPSIIKVPPHWHPVTKNVTVLEGAFYIGMGEKFDEAAGRELKAGSFASMPKGARHFAWAKGETVIQVHGVGPFEITYVNPADDPRKK